MNQRRMLSTCPAAARAEALPFEPAQTCLSCRQSRAPQGRCGTDRTFAAFLIAWADMPRSPDCLDRIDASRKRLYITSISSGNKRYKGADVLLQEEIVVEEYLYSSVKDNWQGECLHTKISAFLLIGRLLWAFTIRLTVDRGYKVGGAIAASKIKKPTLHLSLMIYRERNRM